MVALVPSSSRRPRRRTYSTAAMGLLFVNVELQDRSEDSDEFWSQAPGQRPQRGLTAAASFRRGFCVISFDSDFRRHVVAMLVRQSRE